MKEVKEKRYAGPFEEIPYKDDFIQSPVGLVPKDGGKECRLIFHLSHPRNNRDSVNSNTPPEDCKVNYTEFDEAIWVCLSEGVNCTMGKSDIKSAFRILGILKQHWRYLIFKARCPLDGKFYYFIDKCLPFGASISCSHFQRFSDALAHLVKWKTSLQMGVNKPLINYLDDFLFIALLKKICRGQMNIFMELCEQLGVPVKMEKTEWPLMQIVFLRLLIDAINQVILLPKEKIETGQMLLNEILDRKTKKVTIHKLQKLAGFLNFLGRAVVPGQAFTRRLYAYTKSKTLKPHYHVRVNGKLQSDMLMWKQFLHHPSIFARPFLDFSSELVADRIFMYSDMAR